jgi:hypothetical protein
MTWIAVLSVCIAATGECKPIQMPGLWLTEQRCQTLAAIESGRVEAKLGRSAPRSAFTVSSQCRTSHQTAEVQP